MKNPVRLALCATLALASAASAVAQTPPTYVGVNVGRSDQKLDLHIFGNSEESTAAKLYAGYRFNETFGVEAGYVQHGKTDFPLSGTVLSVKPRSLYLAATATLPLANQFAVFGKLGASANKLKMRNLSVSARSESHTSLLAGIGASYAFTPMVAGVIEYEHFGKLLDQDGATLKAQVLSIGVRASF